MWRLFLFSILITVSHGALEALCPAGGEPVCAKSGYEFIYFENECKLNVFSYKELFAGRPRPVKVALEECFSNCEGIICPAVFQPVCAQQVPAGPVKTVPNACLVNQLICETRQQWLIVANGPCPEASATKQGFYEVFGLNAVPSLAPYTSPPAPNAPAPAPYAPAPTPYSSASLPAAYAPVATEYASAALVPAQYSSASVASPPSHAPYVPAPVPSSPESALYAPSPAEYYTAPAPAGSSYLSAPYSPAPAPNYESAQTQPAKEQSSYNSVSVPAPVPSYDNAPAPADNYYASPTSAPSPAPAPVSESYSPATASYSDASKAAYPAPATASSYDSVPAPSPATNYYPAPAAPPASAQYSIPNAPYAPAPASNYAYNQDSASASSYDPAAVPAPATNYYAAQPHTGSNYEQPTYNQASPLASSYDPAPVPAPAQTIMLHQSQRMLRCLQLRPALPTTQYQHQHHHRLHQSYNQLILLPISSASIFGTHTICRTTTKLRRLFHSGNENSYAAHAPGENAYLATGADPAPFSYPYSEYPAPTSAPAKSTPSVPTAYATNPEYSVAPGVDLYAAPTPSAPYVAPVPAQMHTQRFHHPILHHLLPLIKIHTKLPGTHHAPSPYAAPAQMQITPLTSSYSSPILCTATAPETAVVAYSAPSQQTQPQSYPAHPIPDQPLTHTHPRRSRFVPAPVSDSPSYQTPDLYQAPATDMSTYSPSAPAPAAINPYATEYPIPASPTYPPAPVPTCGCSVNPAQSALGWWPSQPQISTLKYDIPAIIGAPQDITGQYAADLATLISQWTSQTGSPYLAPFYYQPTYTVIEFKSSKPPVAY
ncbi:unnamed protein product [Ceratitis capitata]|uniref:(Mediterranean fruit fly) hypothetical protein n=1 Tax=Ceratitis capitata TaxID=7213 RepID=A0A811V8V9_CERCA|nr:unnamed protein product [Ceratitis capitata]